MRRWSTALAITSLIAAVIAPAAFAQNLGFHGIGGRLGFVDADGLDGAIVFGWHVDLGEIHKNLVLFPSIDYFSKNKTDILSLNGNLRYYFPSKSTVDFFAGGGLALMITNRPRGRGDNELSLNLTGGADFSWRNNLIVTGQLIYSSELDQIKFMAGITVLVGH